MIQSRLPPLACRPSPHKGGDHLRRAQRLEKDSCMQGPAVGAKSETLLFSPLVGEMPGRAEGGISSAT
ncbi:lytic murein transglycosylase [Sinorhizobium meliloti]|nr:lytic murein transglycosylase [Sinorhizobium meliloti]RVH00558.1 lytic murein transglycosylase [Sinorhizobium meliloti]RVH70096.1 lytic murein transglycosylase [Sinorhizobium meliloti]RVH81534.1 lytic murein transglycosylase [Sinorhizobium meliloti]RVL98492.1 lytic murein transglycosylase [Sinorhizobium meliloti]